MKVQELETYKEQYRKSQDEVKAVKAKVNVDCCSLFITVIVIKIQVAAADHKCYFEQCNLNSGTHLLSVLIAIGSSCQNQALIQHF